jgi:hypothetical protein
MLPFRPVLVTFAGPSPLDPHTLRITTDVQVWRGNVCVTTVRILDIFSMDEPKDFDPSCVEQFAGIMSRIASVRCDEEMYARLASRTVHTWHDLERQFPVPTVDVQ